MASLDARAAHDASGGDQSEGGDAVRAGHTTPIYKRLPPGPHRLERDQVLRHQRLRMQGAMVEAVAANGYEATSVKQLIGLAGVSRRSFYEQFANKQECFLATFDLLARRLVTHIGANCDADCEQLEERLRPPLEALARCAADAKAMTLVLAAPPRLGPIGIGRLCQASAACERMLGEAFDACAQADSLPPVVLRAIAGGAQAAIARQLGRPARDRDQQELARDLLRWMMLFATPSASALASSHAPARRPGHARASRPTGGAAAPPPPGQDIRARLLDSVLRLTAVEDYGELTGPRIADEAGVPIDAFFASFSGHEECFSAAVEDVGDGLLQLVGERGAGAGDWPRWLRRTLALLLRRLAERPVHARTVAELAFLGGEPCAAANLQRLRALTAALTAGAPAPAPDVEMIAGGLLHALRAQAAVGRLRMLPLLADQLAFFMMAPCVGAQQALAALGERTGAAPWTDEAPARG